MRLAVVAAVLFALVYLFVEDSLGPLGPVVKMAPVSILGLLVLRGSSKPARRLAGYGLLTGAAADALIQFSFLGGLVVFLVAHLFYIAAFVRIERSLHALRLIPVALWAAVALPLLAGHAGPLQIPVLVYGLVIFTMIWRAAAAWDSAGGSAGEIGLIGALFFGLSDTLLGYSRFVSPLPASGFLIMGTYWAGQSLIAMSFMKRE
jgi:alkenylglycerophosphocholine/alkenylglycerophosphoethanolamine hydrolase